MGGGAGDRRAVGRAREKEHLPRSHKKRARVTQRAASRARAETRARGGGAKAARTRRASGLTLRMYESARNTTDAVNVNAKAIHHAVVDIDVAAETTLDILLRSERQRRGAGARARRE